MIGRYSNAYFQPQNMPINVISGFVFACADHFRPLRTFESGELAKHFISSLYVAYFYANI